MNIEIRLMEFTAIWLPSLSRQLPNWWNKIITKEPPVKKLTNSPIIAFAFHHINSHCWVLITCKTTEAKGGLLRLIYFWVSACERVSVRDSQCLLFNRGWGGSKSGSGGSDGGCGFGVRGRGAWGLNSVVWSRLALSRAAELALTT